MTMKSLTISSFRQQKLTLSQIQIPTLSSNNDLLVKVLYSPINPSDLGWINGIYGTPKSKSSVSFPLSIGFEGFGVVEQSKSSQIKKGEFVSFYSEPGSGTWSEYVKIDLKKAVKIGNFLENSDEKMKISMSMLYINPLTSYSFLNILMKNKEKSCVLTASNSMLGRIITKLFHMKDIKVLNISRSEKDYQENSLLFFENLKKESFLLKTKTGFDCYGGDVTGKLLNCLVDEGKVFHFGNQTMRSVSNIQSEDLLFRRKSVRGFWLMDYLNSEEGMNVVKWFENELEENMKSGVFECKDYRVCDFHDVNDVNFCVEEYRKSMKFGKVVFKM